jgi:hypothetical protein
MSEGHVWNEFSLDSSEEKKRFGPPPSQNRSSYQMCICQTFLTLTRFIGNTCNIYISKWFCYERTMYLMILIMYYKY